MDIITAYYLGAAIIAGLTVFNFIKVIGHKQGQSETELKAVQHELDTAEKAWSVKFDALYSRFDLVERQTSERFERTQDKVNEALLTMAREHPTKKDLHELESRIIAHIDFALSRTAQRNTKPAPSGS